MGIDPELAPRRPRSPSLADALIPVVMLIALLVAAFLLFGGDATGGPVQVALILCAMVAGIVGLKNGHSAEDLGKAAVNGISMAVGAIFILLSVGALIGTWNMSGTIATMTYFGIQFLSANWFYLAATIVCAAIALGIGSSWTVIGTIGVALIAIATALGVSPFVTAGAVISGSYFGDKISPLSETTNLSAAVAGTDLYTHIKGMMVTTVPSILIALVIYAILGLREEPKEALDPTAALEAISSVFNVGILTLIPLFGVIILAIRKTPASLAIMTGALLGGLVAVILQPDVVLTFVDDPSLSTPAAMVKGVWTAMATGFVIDTGIPGLDALVSGGGMASMLGTVWLILGALAFGGIMEDTGMLNRLIEPMLRRVNSDNALLVSTGVTGIAVNMIAADQYLAIVLTGNMYRGEYEERNIAPETLSRQIEDTATVTSPLIPWNSCGAYVSASLGIATLSYLPFCFFNLINPLISLIYAALGFQIKKVGEDVSYEKPPKEAAFYGIGGKSIEMTAPEV